MGKGEKGLNPADAFRRAQKKQDIKKSKKQQAELKEVRSLLNDSSKIEAEIEKYQKVVILRLPFGIGSMVVDYYFVLSVVK
jgi:hypothetical protein